MRPSEEPIPNPVHRMFDLEDIQAHYRIKRTKALELVNDPAFLRSVVPGMHRYLAAPPAPARPRPKPRGDAVRKVA